MGPWQNKRPLTDCENVPPFQRSVVRQGRINVEKNQQLNLHIVTRGVEFSGPQSPWLMHVARAEKYAMKRLHDCHMCISSDGGSCRRMPGTFQLVPAEPWSRM